MNRTEWGQGRRRFLPMKDEITAALRAGQTRREIWAANEERLGLQYSGFARLVSRYIGDLHPTVSQPASPRSSTSQTHPSVQPAQPEQDLVRPDTPADDLASSPRRKQNTLVFNPTPSKEYVRDRLGPPKPKD